MLITYAEKDMAKFKRSDIAKLDTRLIDRMFIPLVNNLAPLLLIPARIEKINVPYNKPILSSPQIAISNVQSN